VRALKVHGHAIAPFEAEITSPGVMIDELEALRSLDLVAPPEAVPELPEAASELRAPPSSDRLRLGPPPMRAKEGYALYQSMGRAVACFEACGGSPIAADERALVAEARLMTLVRGIHALEHQIRTEMARHHRA
jgi:hypothetical protein